MAEKRKSRGAGFWCTIVITGALLLYPISFGPVCWVLSARESKSTEFGTPIVRAPRVYWPVGWVAQHCPSVMRRAIVWYATLFGSPLIAVPDGPVGDHEVALFDLAFFGKP